MNRVIFYSAGLCVLAILLEGLCAGAGIRKRLADLNKPRLVPPLWGWIVIGGFYYVMCFAVLYRVFALPVNTPLRKTAIALMLILMSINAGWNWFFFRSRNLFYAFLIGLPYSVIAMVLLAVLFDADRAAALWLAPYLIYLCYANVWGYSIWKLNPAVKN